MALDPVLDYTNPDVRNAQLALRQKARAGKVYDKPPIIPEIAKAYQADPRTRLALTALTNGTSTAPVAAGKYGIAEGIARALTAPLGAYIDKQQQQKYGGVTDDTLDKEDLRDRGAAQAQAALAAHAAAAQAPPVADTPAPPQADPTALPPPQQQAPPPPPPTAANTGPPLPGGGAPMNVNPTPTPSQVAVASQFAPPPPQPPQGIGVVPGRTMAPIPAQGGVPVGTRPFAPPPAGLPPPVATAASVPSPAPVASAVSDTATRLAAAKTTLQAQGLKVNSGYRTPAHNAEVGGVNNSFHMSGTPDAPLAYDFSPAPGQTMAQAAAAVQAAAPGFKVLNEGNHIHVQPPSGTPHTGAPVLASAAAAPSTGLGAPPPEPIPDLPAVLSKPTAPTPVAARQSELLKAAYAIAQDRDEVAYSRGQDLKAAGLAEQDRMNESAAEREQRIADMGYQSGLSAYNQSVQDRTQYGYKSAEDVAAANRAAGVSALTWQRQVQEKALDRASELERTQITAAAKGNSAQDLTDEERGAVNAAVGQKRLDLKGLTNRQIKIVAGALVANPGMDAIQLHAFANLAANPAAQQKAMTTEALPSILQNVREAGKNNKFNDIRFIGKAQAALKGQLNDPDYVNYMTQRNDAMLTIAQVMRGTGATDMSTKMENEAANPSMSPKAWDAWYSAQLHALRPRVAIAERKGLVEKGTLAQVDAAITGTAPAATPAAAASSGWGKAVEH